MIHTNRNVTHAGKCTSLKPVGLELMRRIILEEKDENLQSPPIKSNPPFLPHQPNQNKTKIAAPTIRGKVDARPYTIEDTPNQFEQDFLTECNEKPTQDWQRRRNLGMILRHNARHQDDPKPPPEWITEAPDNYATLKRPLPESKTDSVYIYDTDSRCGPWDEPTIYETNTLSFKILVRNPQKRPETVPEFPALSPIQKKSELTPIVPVTVTSTPIKAENIICMEDKTIWSRQAKQQRADTLSPLPPPQTARATEVPDNNEETIEYPPPLPEDLEVIKEEKGMLFLPIEFNNVTIDALVDSGTDNIAISEKDVEKNQTQRKRVHHK